MIVSPIRKRKRAHLSYIAEIFLILVGGLPFLRWAFSIPDFNLAFLLNPSGGSRLRRGVEGIEDEDVLWEAPPLQTTKRRRPPQQQEQLAGIRGILFVAHGCNHKMTDWWEPSQVCPECIGLPEERAIVDMAHERNLLVVAMSSTSTCWSERDGPRVARVLQSLQKDHNGVPIIAFGASSGGAFVSSILPLHIDIVGFISQVMTQPPATTPKGGAVYITMSQDLTSSMQAKAIIDERRPLFWTIELQPSAITPTFFSSRIPSISTFVSGKLHDALYNENYLDPVTRQLRNDPRQTTWRLAIQPIVEKYHLTDTLVADKSGISEVLNVAWAKHELARDGVDFALDKILRQS